MKNTYGNKIPKWTLPITLYPERNKNVVYFLLAFLINSSAYLFIYLFTHFINRIVVYVLLESFLKTWLYVADYFPPATTHP